MEQIIKWRRHLYREQLNVEFYWVIEYENKERQMEAFSFCISINKKSPHF
jgi:hypothetical protein